MKKLTTILGVLALIPSSCFALQTLAQLQANYNAGNQVVVGIIGNSIGCGYRAPGTYQAGTDRIAPTLTTGAFAGQTTSATMAVSGLSSYAVLLNNWLKAKNPNSVVQNLSGSGWTTGGHLANGTVAQMAAMSPKPTHVFIALNVNDRGKDNINFNLSSISGPGGTYSNYGFPYSTYQTQLATIVSQVISAGMTPILVKENYEPFDYGPGDSLTGNYYWCDLEYVGTTGPVGNPANHVPYATYIGYVDTLAASSTCTGSALGTACPILDTYTPTTNTGQVGTYIYDTGKPSSGDPSPLGTAHDTAPVLFRSDLAELWIPFTPPIFDPIHPNGGHAVIFAQYKALISGTSAASNSLKIPYIKVNGTVTPAAGICKSNSATSACMPQGN